MKKGIKKVIHKECGCGRVRHRFSLNMLDLCCPRCGRLGFFSFTLKQKLEVIRMIEEEREAKVKLKDITILFRN